MTTSKTPFNCKIVIDNHVIEYGMKFNYLGIAIWCYADIEREVRAPVSKVSRTPACLNGTIWQNNHIKKVKVRIFKITIDTNIKLLETLPEISKKLNKCWKQVKWKYYEKSEIKAWIILISKETNIYMQNAYVKYRRRTIWD